LIILPFGNYDNNDVLRNLLFELYSNYRDICYSRYSIHSNQICFFKTIMSNVVQISCLISYSNIISFNAFRKERKRLLIYKIDIRRNQFAFLFFSYFSITDQMINRSHASREVNDAYVRRNSKFVIKH